MNGELNALSQFISAVRIGMFAVDSVCRPGSKMSATLPSLMNARLALADRQLRAVLDLPILDRIADREHAGLVHPVDDVDELLRNKTHQAHGWFPRM